MNRRLLRSDAQRLCMLVIGAWLGLAGAIVETASAQECPYGYPVDCGTYCCEGGGTCYNGGCNAPQEPEPDPGQGTCPSGYPVDCGTYCCESGGTCYNGGCNAPQGPDPGPDPDPGQGTCPSGYPVDCGTYCCESGGTCYDGGCNAPDQPGASSCPDGYPVDCGTFCCGSGASCGSNDTCLAGSYVDQVVEACPAAYPVDCGNDYCCPSGSTCTVNGCMDLGGTPIDGSELICASQAINTDFGACNLDFCIANANGNCESYYVVNGARISCAGCAADASCIQIAGEACTDSGVTQGPAAYSMSSPPEGGGGCCETYDACDWANDGACDCDGAYGDSWDANDCAGEDEPEICSAGAIGAMRAPNATRGQSALALAFAVLGLTLLQRKRRR